MEESQNSAAHWTASQMIEIWARAKRDQLPNPLAELRRLSGMGGQAVRSELLSATVTMYVEESPGFVRARPALVWRHVHGRALEEYPALGSGQTLMRSLLEHGWADLIYLHKSRIPIVAEYRFWWELHFRIQDDPPKGDLARAFTLLKSLDEMEGPITESEKVQLKLLISIRRALKRGDTRTARTNFARLAKIREGIKSCGSESKNCSLGSSKQ